MHIIVGDTVEVIAGNDRGQRGKVLSVDHTAGKLVVEGMNRVLKHLKRSQKNPQGGRLSKEMPIQLSNVMLVSPATGKPTRTGVRITSDGARELYCKSSGSMIRRLSPPKKQRIPKTKATAK
ncbi:MAG TPA: 50S ribosomal protein L24 [Pirellulales bacterium]|jgi:large subunit ribosomal protein L24|nr:50S ribosomal protein L24 [Pirellulales bacterium]